MRNCLVVLVLFLLTHPSSFADESWVGKRVFFRPGAVAKIGKIVVDKYQLGPPSTIYQENGDWLWIGNGWVQRKDVISPQDEMVYLTIRINSSPNNKGPLLERGIVWAELGNLENAIKDFTEAIRLDPKISASYYNRGVAELDNSEFDKANQDFQHALKLDPRCARCLNSLAWLKATCPDDSFRNGKEAIELATKASELTELKVWFCLGTLAAAYAETGDFVKAINWQEKAIEIDPSDKKGSLERLDLYKASKPYRYVPKK